MAEVGAAMQLFWNPSYLEFVKQELVAAVYTDASMRGGYCGIGVCVLDAKTERLVSKTSRRVAGYEKNNTALEARAICEGIALAASHGFTDIRVYTDSQSLVQAATGGRARKRAVKQFVKAIKNLRDSIQVTLFWVRGHAQHKWNEMSDYLARNARWSFGQLWVMFAKPFLSGLIDLLPLSRRECSS